MCISEAVFNFSGVVPWFLREKPPPPVHTPDVDVLRFFPETQSDGLNVVWSHRTNNEKSLMEAMKGKACITITSMGDQLCVLHILR